MAPLSFAAALLYLDWSEYHSYRTNRPKSHTPRSGNRVSDAHRIDREGRRLDAKAKSDADFKKVEEKYLEVLRMFRKLKHPRGEAEVLNDLGISYVHRNQYSRATDFYEKSLKIKRKVGWHWGEGDTLVNLGGIYETKRKYSQAVEYYEQAAKVYGKGRPVVDNSWHKRCIVYRHYTISKGPMIRQLNLTRGPRKSPVSVGIE